VLDYQISVDRSGAAVIAQSTLAVPFAPGVRHAVVHDGPAIAGIMPMEYRLVPM
jgi:hypothetical protein